jgi:hypothetical protein
LASRPQRLIQAAFFSEVLINAFSPCINTLVRNAG